MINIEHVKNVREQVLLALRKVEGSVTADAPPDRTETPCTAALPAPPDWPRELKHRLAAIRAV